MGQGRSATAARYDAHYYARQRERRAQVVALMTRIERKLADPTLVDDRALYEQALDDGRATLRFIDQELEMKTKLA